jgi:hypothetical protein
LDSTGLRIASEEEKKRKITEPASLVRPMDILTHRFG